jgi:hypothetical protein
MLINVRYKKDLITVDIRTRQVRYVRDYFSGDSLKMVNQPIGFFDIGRDGADGYEYLYEHDKKLFFDSLIEDCETWFGKKIKRADLKIVKLQ